MQCVCARGEEMLPVLWWNYTIIIIVQANPVCEQDGSYFYTPLWCDLQFSAELEALTEKMNQIDTAN